MPSWPDEDEAPIPLVRRPVRKRADDAADHHRADTDASALPDARDARDDRMSPAVAGGLAGFAGGLAALGVVHGLEPHDLARPIVEVAAVRGVAVAVAFGIAYATSASIGSLVGGTFAVVTRYLERWGPLLVWALVFFVSLALLLLAATSANGRGLGPAFSGPVLAASAAYAVVVSFSLPIRLRR